MSKFSESAKGRLRSLLVASVLLGAMGILAPLGRIQLGLVTASATLAVVGIVMFALSFKRQRSRKSAYGTIADFIEKDASPSFVVCPDGEVRSINEAGRKQFGAVEGETLAGTLRNTFANPGGILFRLKALAEANGAAREDIVTRKGHVRLSVHQMGTDAFLWRMENVPEPAAGRGSDGPLLPMLMVGRSNAILFMNDAARRLVGQRVKSLNDLIGETPLPLGTPAVLTTGSGPVDVQFACVDAGAGRRALYILPVADAPQNDPLWSSFEALPVPLLRVAADGQVRAFNKTAYALIGVGLDEDVHLSELMEGLGRPISDWLSETLSGRAVQHSEFLRLKRADKEMFVQVALNRVTEDGEASLIAVLTDATELKTLEAQFVQSQKMQAIGQLAGGVAHDFNNLLTAISGHCDLLLLRHDQGDADYSDLIQINQNANRAAALVGQLLAFSRKQTLRPEVLDMRDTLADLTHLLNRLVGETVTLTLSHDPVLQSIRADKRQLEQVLMNLVVNARDAMPDGGEIRIVTECEILTQPLDRGQVSVPAGSYVTVRVNDEGVGIAPDKLQKVFEPFFTTKRTGEGTGLGLSTAYGIVKQTGGYIFVDSKLGQGTCFTLYFPVLDAVVTKPKVARRAKPKEVPNHGDGVILLVEDEAPVRAFASRALRLRGYTVLEADSAEMALKTLEGQSLNVDLFVTDVVMPGKDGPSWVREALQDRPDVRVVFVSGYAEDKFSDAKNKIPNSVFLPKPFSLNDLTETVHRQLH
ncbi:MAG: ATP-binding protein [Ascidiaceihabitans sp.]|uniref:hybrid sensor histidine kinase/response regulator n=1 Tax=Ascidiaceihabitans sp. TaxID=1872644 RepID=UPI003297D7F4